MLVGGQDLTRLNFPQLNLSIDGWYDYAVWDAAPDGTPRMIAAEHYMEPMQFNEEPLEEVPSAPQGEAPAATPGPAKHAPI